MIACRDMKKAEAAADEIRRDTKDVEGAGQVLVIQLDLGSIKSIRECAREILRTEQKIDILVNNAGKRNIHCNYKLAALAQMVACLPLVQQVWGSIPGGLVNFHLKIFNLGARRGGDVHFLIARLYITYQD